MQVWCNDYTMPEVKALIDKNLISGQQSILMINDQPYIPVRYFFEKLGAKVDWDAAAKEAVIKKGGKEVRTCGILVDDRTMAPAELLTSMFDVNVEFYSDINVLQITSGGTEARLSKQQAINALPRYDSYTQEDLYWLSRIVHAEAKGESYSSKLAVANVILNRVESDLYPNTIKAVIFDKKHGVQFTPTINGSIYNTPSEESFLAALEALEGKNNAGDTLFFINPKYAKSTWVPNNREYAFTMGGHNFYN